MSTRLPVEFIQQILESIKDTSSLENLFQVARPLTQQFIATILYREIVVLTSAKDVVIDSSLQFFGGLHIHRIIIHDYPWLIPYVEQLTLLVGPGPSGEVETTIYIKEVLPVLINLKRFHYEAQPGHGPLYPLQCIAQKVLEGGFQPSLTHFIWRSDMGSTHADALAAFLASQSQLEHLEIGADIPDLTLPADSLQELRLLRSYPAVVRSILPGRHVIDLAIPLILRGNHLEAPGLQLGEAFHHVQTLRVDGVAGDGWPHLVQHFVNLEFLKIERAPLSIILMNTMVEESKPAKLRYLQIAASWRNFETEASLVPVVFEHLPSLQVLDYEIGSGHEQFKRICRGTEEPSIVNISRDAWKPWWHGCRLEKPGGLSQVCG